MEKVIYDRYKVVVIGSVPIWTRANDGREASETRRLQFTLEGEIDTSMLHRKPRRKFAEDGRLKAWGSGGRTWRQPPSDAPARLSSGLGNHSVDTVLTGDVPTGEEKLEV